MNEVQRWLENPLVVVGICAIFGGLFLLFVAWAFTGEYEKGGYTSVHRRPSDTEAKPWMLDSGGQPIVRPARHRFAGTPDEGTRRLMPVTNTARSRVVLIGPEGIEDGNHAGTARRVRQVEKVNGEEEGGADRERREDEGRPFAYGEEGGAHEEAAREVNARWFRNSVSGEYVFIDEHGRRVEFES